MNETRILDDFLGSGGLCARLASARITALEANDVRLRAALISTRASLEAVSIYATRDGGVRLDRVAQSCRYALGRIDAVLAGEER